MAQSAEMQNTLTASLQRGKTPPSECPEYDIQQSYLWGLNNARALMNVEYPFIASSLTSTLAWIGSTW